MADKLKGKTMSYVRNKDGSLTEKGMRIARGLNTRGSSSWEVLRRAAFRKAQGNKPQRVAERWPSFVKGGSK